MGGPDNRFLTSAQVNWDNIPGWQKDSTYYSPNISSIIQEIVNMEISQ